MMFSLFVDFPKMSKEDWSGRKKLGEQMRKETVQAKYRVI